jgi:RNA polymerase sigma-70 factor (ECF subfamily)
MVLEHQGVIRSYLARLAPDPVTADDLAQEVFLAAWKQIDRIDPSIGVRPYLIGIARNLARSAWRDRARGRRAMGEELFRTLESRIRADDTGEDVRLDALSECLNRLGPRAAEVVLRHYRDEERCDEIAASLGTAVSSIRSILTRVRRALHDCIQARTARAAP